MDTVKLYEKALFIRVFEEKLDSLFEKGLVNGTAHFCIGQEYIPVIISQYLKSTDIVTSTHRGHGHALAKDLKPEKIMAEILGKKTGCNSGKAGSQHIISKKDNYFTNGVTGGMIPVAVGMAFANKYRKGRNIVIAYLGDGGFNEGYVQEALNLAAVLKLPILFVCENNQYAMSTPTKTSHAADICQRVGGLGIVCQSIGNNDYRKLDLVAQNFIKKIRATNKPHFIEVKTYRHLGHSKNDQNLYRSKKEEKDWLKTDVLLKLEKQLPKKKVNLLKKRAKSKIEAMATQVLSQPANDSRKINAHLYHHD